MNIAVITMLAAAVGVGLPASGGRTDDKNVSVCVENNAGFSVLPLAEETASKMFGEAGVTIDWRSGLVGCPPQGILISLFGPSDHAPADLAPSALAYALPYEGSHIVIFYDRLQRKVQRGEIPPLLAHVLVHEVTHILQGIHRHSGRGVMKANWDGSDYQAMRWKPLSFTPEDIDLIHRGLAARAARAASPR